MAAVAVVSLAVGMSINAAAFSIIDTILYKPLPIREAHTLVRVSGTRTDNLSYPLFEDLARDTTTLRGLTAYQFAGTVFDDGGSPDIVALGLVSANYFTTLGVPAVVGRTLGAPELLADTPPAIVARLESACRQALEDPAYRKLTESQNQQAEYLDRNAFGARVDADFRSKGALIPTLKLPE